MRVVGVIEQTPCRAFYWCFALSGSRLAARLSPSLRERITQKSIVPLSYGVCSND